MRNRTGLPDGWRACPGLGASSLAGGRRRACALKLKRRGPATEDVPEMPLAVKPVRPASTLERERRAEALRRHRADRRVQSVASTGELAYLRTQLRVAARLTARLAAIQDVSEMVQLVVDELHGTFAFYLVGIQRLESDGVLRLVAGTGRLAEIMTEFLLVEQSVDEGVNGRVARSGRTALISDTRSDQDYIVRDPQTDPRSELPAHTRKRAASCAGSPPSSSTSAPSKPCWWSWPRNDSSGNPASPVRLSSFPRRFLPRTRPRGRLRTSRGGFGAGGCGFSAGGRDFSARFFGSRRSTAL